MAEEFRKLVNQTRRGGGDRRKILEYIASHPGATPYEISKFVYGGKDYTGAVIRHLRKLERVWNIWVLKIERDGRGAFHIYLTDEGRKLSQNEGLNLSSGKVEEFIYEFNKLLDIPLTLEETEKLQKLLSDRIIDVLIEIASSVKVPLISLPEPRPLDALWFYDAEKNHIRRDEIKSGLSKFIYDVCPQLQNFPPNLVRKKTREVIEDINLDALLAEHLMAVPIAKKHGIEASLDKLVDFLGRIATIVRGRLVGEDRKKAHEIYAYRYGTAVQLAIAQRYRASLQIGKKLDVKAERGGQKRG